MRGGATALEGAVVKPTIATSLTSGGMRAPQACICSAMASSARCTTNSPLARMLAAVSLMSPSACLLMLIITMGGSSPSMLNIEKGAALTTPAALTVVTSAIGRGTIRLDISL